MSKQDKNNSSDSFELDLSNIDDETIFDSEVSKPDDDEELEDPIDYFKNTFLSTYKLEHPNDLINLLYQIQNNEYTGRSVGKIREMKVKFRRFVSLMNKINAGIKSKGNRFLSLKEYTTDKKSLDTIINYFNIVVNDDLNYSSDGFRSSPIKPPRKSQTPQTTKGRRKRTSIHEPTLDTNKRRTPRRKRITPSDSDENDSTIQLPKDSEDSLLNITLSESDSESLILKNDDLSDSFIEPSKEHNKNNFSTNKMADDNNNNNGPLQSLYDDELDDWHDDDEAATEAYRYTKTPAKQPYKYDDDEEEAQEIKSPFARKYKGYAEDNKADDEILDELIRNAKQPSKNTRGRRDKKDMPLVNSTLKDSFDKLEIPRVGGNISYYRDKFIDMIINGNFRIKYIPNAACRDTAIEYCKNSVDKDGKPRYRLLPENAKDPLGNSITDLNGDKVDDVVLIDRNGNPSIINGYKLVFASPYKKVWKSVIKTKQERKEMPFNKWIQSLFDKDIKKIDWDAGQYKLTKGKEMQELENYYGPMGLGKARVSKRITPNSYWSSIFSKVWKVYWNDEQFFVLSPLKKLINYLAVSNMLFAYLFDAPFKEIIQDNKFNGKILTYEQWTYWKQQNNKEYVSVLGKNVQSYVEKIIDKAIDITSGELKAEPSNWGKQFTELMHYIDYVVFGVGFNVDVSKQEGYNRLKRNAEGIKEATPEDIKNVKDNFIKRITAAIERDIYPNCGYTAFKAQLKESKLQNKNKYDNFAVNLKPLHQRMNNE